MAGDDSNAIVDLVELVLGAAVMCNDAEARAVFIENIFSLDHESQTFLKDIIQSVMSRAMDLSEDEEATGSTGLPRAAKTDSRDAALEESLIRAEEASRHLREEQHRLHAVIADLEQSNSELSKENTRLKASVGEYERDKLSSPTKKTIEGKVAALAALQVEVDELRRELDMKIVEIETLKAESSTYHRRWEAAIELNQKLTIESQQMGDELDVARDKASKLVKAEATIEKYQQKLEEMNGLKKQNKELASRLDQYLDQINHLESSNKSITTLQRLVEQYKDKAVELEREKFEALSSSQMKEHEVAQLQKELAAVSKTRNQLEAEVGSLRVELSQFEDSQRGPGEGATLGDDFTSDTVPSLKEKVKRLEYEIAGMKSSGSGSSTDLALVQAEVEDLRRIKKER